MESLLTRIRALLTAYGFQTSDWVKTEDLLHDTCNFSKNSIDYYICVAQQRIVPVNHHTVVGINMVRLDSKRSSLLQLHFPIQSGYEDRIIARVNACIDLL